MSYKLEFFSKKNKHNAYTCLGFYNDSEELKKWQVSMFKVKFKNSLVIHERNMTVSLYLIKYDH